MVTAEKSLRVLVEKWLGSTRVGPVRVLLLHRSRSGRTRCVCVEAQRAADSLRLFFFRHDDGTWHVFPPETARPAMSAGRLAA